MPPARVTRTRGGGAGCGWVNSDAGYAPADTGHGTVATVATHSACPQRTLHVSDPFLDHLLSFCQPWLLPQVLLLGHVPVVGRIKPLLCDKPAANTATPGWPRKLPALAQARHHAQAQRTSSTGLSFHGFRHFAGNLPDLRSCAAACNTTTFVV